jgi:hypothetical protein
MGNLPAVSHRCFHLPFEQSEEFVCSVPAIAFTYFIIIPAEEYFYPELFTQVRNWACKVPCLSRQQQNK